MENVISTNCLSINDPFLLKKKDFQGVISINQSINQEIDLQLQKVSKLQSKILVEKRVIKYLQINLENKRECFEKNKYV